MVDIVRIPGLDETDDEPLWPVEPGRPLVDEYLARRRLGVSRRCETWLAWDPNRNSPVVVKLPRPGQSDQLRARASLARQSDWLLWVAHPGFPRLLADGQAATVPYLVTEYVDGPLLSHAIHGHPLDTADAVLLTLHLAASLRRLHRLGVAHLDLEPANVVIHDGRPVLLDLGSVRPFGYRIGPGPAMGSAGYASPDLEAGAPIDRRMDIYALGLILLESLAGVAAFDPGVAAADRRDPRAVTDRLTGSGRPVGELAIELLCPDPSGRPASIEAVTRSLAAHLPTPEPSPWPEWAEPMLPHDVARAPLQMV